MIMEEEDHPPSPPSPPPPGRVVRVHLACIARLPVGTTLRVTGTHLWDPVEWRRCDGGGGGGGGGGGDDGGGGGGDGGGVPEEGDEVRGGDLRPSATTSASAGTRDPRSHSMCAPGSVEMVTCPDTYPLWRTRRPVVLTSSSSSSSSVRGGGGVLRHRYRYLAVTPGAEAANGAAAARGGGAATSDDVLDGDSLPVEDLGNMIRKTFADFCFQT
jgi:hypothetical protein